jgi:phosphoheptose isomerase
MSFPDTMFKDAVSYLDAYASAVSNALASIDRTQFAAAVKLLTETYDAGRTVYVCGNGGSAAIANHLHCDHMKGVQTDTGLRPKIVSLVSVMETMTAIANDIDFADVFSYQLRTLAEAGDVLITISSSGDSENVVRATKWAKDNNVRSLSLTGFNGGRTRVMSDVNLHIDGDNYGVVEDAHQSVMHILAQYIRLCNMCPSQIEQKLF